jgi:dTDP-4-dehydrorhamnose 3,5-epimerase
VCIVRAPVHADCRGFLTEVFHDARFVAIGLPTVFAQDNHSRSGRHVLRGLHAQLENPQGKLIRPVTGVVFEVAVDLRHSSPAFGRWTGVTLEAGDGRQLWVPPGFAHGFLVLSDSADVTYKCTTVYDKASTRAIRWNDSDIGIRWPLPPGVEPMLSSADAAAVPFRAQRWFE